MMPQGRQRWPIEKSRACYHRQSRIADPNAANGVASSHPIPQQRLSMSWEPGRLSAAQEALFAG